MGLSFDILIFDYLLKAPQPVTGLFFSGTRSACEIEYHPCSTFADYTVLMLHVQYFGQ